MRTRGRPGAGACMRCSIRGAGEATDEEVDAVWDVVKARRAAADDAAPYVEEALRRESRYGGADLIPLLVGARVEKPQLKK